MRILEPTPTPKRTSCKVLVFGIALGLGAGPWALVVWGWWQFHWSFGILFGVFGYLLTGVISSKMRQVSIPKDQREISFTSHEIARWYVVRYLCCDA
ncbi:MAG: hypothetical protein IBX45_03625 [Campylobacterales bacterium]|nr:hypothetical protein [Campylobacterales bacterium]